MTHDFIDPDDLLDTIEKQAEKGESILEVCGSAGASMVAVDDDAKLNLGELALLVEKRHGSEGLREYSRTSGKELDRLGEYKRVVKFFPRKVRKAFFGQYKAAHAGQMPKAVYSKLQIAKRFGELELALDFIEQQPPEVTADAFRVKANEKLGKPAPVTKLRDFEVSRAEAIKQFEKELSTVDTKYRYIQVKIYEVK